MVSLCYTVVITYQSHYSTHTMLHACTRLKGVLGSGGCRREGLREAVDEEQQQLYGG